MPLNIGDWLIALIHFMPLISFDTPWHQWHEMGEGSELQAKIVSYFSDHLKWMKLSLASGPKMAMGQSKCWMTDKKINKAWNNFEKKINIRNKLEKKTKKEFSQTFSMILIWKRPNKLQMGTHSESNIDLVKTKLATLGVIGRG